MIGLTAAGRVCALCLASAAGQELLTDPLVGRWELNVARTHYGGGATPRVRESFTCTAVRAELQCTIRSVMADGRILVAGFTAADDGTPGPTHGIPDVDQVRLTRVSNAIADATFSAGGRPVFGYRVVKASNGRSLTIISVDPTSRTVQNSIVVYDRRY